MWRVVHLVTYFAIFAVAGCQRVDDQIGGLLLTIFSAPNYQVDFHNTGGYLLMTKNVSDNGEEFKYQHIIKAGNYDNNCSSKTNTPSFFKSSKTINEPNNKQEHIQPHRQLKLKRSMSSVTSEKIKK